MSAPLTPLKKLGVILGILSAGMSLLGAYVLLPYRVDVNEKAIQALQRERNIDHELLMRIDERLIMIQHKLDRDRP
jgi:hypothetical protein